MLRSSRDRIPGDRYDLNPFVFALWSELDVVSSGVQVVFPGDVLQSDTRAM